MHSLALALLGATPATTLPAHTVTIDQGGNAVSAIYDGSIALEMRQTGFTPPNRPGNARCTWTSTLKIDRTVTDAQANPITPLNRTLETAVLGQGWRPGDCIETAGAIRKDAAKQTETASGQLAAIAQKDRVQLTGELAALRTGLLGQAD